MKADATEIAARVRVLREIEEISAETLARDLRCDPVEYRQWESGTKDFPVEVLVEIAVRFGVDFSELEQGAASKLKTFCVTRAGEAPEVSRRPVYGYRDLAYHFHHKKAEPFLVEASPETENSPVNQNVHPGQEFVYVLEGRLFISVNGHGMELGPGDSIYYDSGEPHGMKALGGKPARFLAIVLP